VNAVPVVRGGPDHAGKLKLRKLHPPDPAPPQRGSARAPGRLPRGRFARIRREGLIMAAEMAAVIKAAGVFTNGTVIRGGVT
jgi:hypothetical protein